MHSWMGCATAALLLMASLAQAQTVYRVMGPDGRVTFSDQPPAQAAPAASTPAHATTTAATPPARSTQTSTATLPSSLRSVTQRYPVTLYADKDCAPCDDARQFLLQRGIPFTEKTVRTPADVQALQQLSGKTQLPFLTLGTQHLHGFESQSWASYLTAAGYPTTSQLPAQYRRPPATPLTTQTADPAAPAQETAPAQTQPQSETTSSEPAAIDPRLFDPQRPTF